MKNIALTLQYDGSRYSGWQRQGNTDNTIEYKLTRAIGHLFRIEENQIELHGSGRTDAGVHAEGQVANFHVETKLAPERIMAELNQILPEDIRVKKAEIKAPRFHSRLNAVRKTYVYRIDTGEARNVFLRKYAYYHPEKLSLEKMREGAALLIGKQDFRSFTDLKNKNKSTVRELSEIQITERDSIITIRFTGDGFLYHMVRLLTGVLIAAGEGKLSLDEIRDISDRKERPKSLFLAPAQGLTLWEVEYE